MKNLVGFASLYSQVMYFNCEIVVFLFDWSNVCMNAFTDNIFTFNKEVVVNLRETLPSKITLILILDFNSHPLA